MFRRKRLISLLVVAVLAASVQAQVAQVDSVTITRVENPGGSPNFWLESITVGNYTVEVQRLVKGTSEGVATAQPAPYNDITVADNFDINLFAGRANEVPPTHQIKEFGQKAAWSDTNGDNPDFFIFETGGNQDISVEAILPGGIIGQSVTVAQSLWGATGLVITTSGPHNGQTIEGVALAVTDLLDQNGNSLTNSSVIEGIQITSPGYDPSLVCAISTGQLLSAFSPSPADSEIQTQTWASLSWSAGDTAVSHDVYVGDDFDDVNDRTSEAFQGNFPAPPLLIGFLGFPFPEGLVPGTTYYWAVDEVEADGTKHKGPVWSFSIPPTSAHNPSPADGASFMPVDVTLSWTAGLNAKLHTIYFGESFDDVNSATVGTPSATTSFSPATLELNKTYYWRVDESDPPTTVKGEVWSFTTTLPGLGTAVMERWENITTTDINTLKNDARFPNSPDVTETVDSFSWNGPDIDDYGARIEGWLYVPATGDYTFWLNTDDQGELLLSTDDDPSSAVLIAQESSYSGFNAWGAGEEQSDPIPLVGGEKYYIAALWKEGGGGDHCQVAWQGPGIPDRTVIPGTNLSPFEPMSAYGAKPANRAVGVTQTPKLQWKAGLEAASHEVYFGTDPNAVASATKSSPEFVGTRQLGDESYEPAMLAWDATYYWRVDEIDTANPNSPWIGRVWSFTTADFGIVDNFESYDDTDNLVYVKYKDGVDNPNVNGSTIGYFTGASMESVNVHGGNLSVPFQHTNSPATISEVTRALTPAQNWAANGETVLILWFHGDPASTLGQLYFKINGVQVNYDGPASDLSQPIWQRWVIDLTTVGTNLQSVTSFAFGVSGFGATGTLLLDDIELHRSAPELPDQTYLEAEAAASITPPLKIFSDPLASGGSYIGTDDGIGDENDNPPADGVATYSFTAEAGTYRIVFRAKPDAGNSFWVRIPGATDYDPGTHGSGWIRFNDIEAGAEWHWDEVHSSDHGNAVVKITLPAGQHTLEIARREDGALLDAILITENAD
jgi:hypothetical protein